MVLATTAAVPLGRAAAQTSDDGGVYDVRWEVDLAIVGVAAAVWSAPQPFKDRLLSAGCPCDRSRVPDFDRFSLGRSSDAAGTASDIAIATLVTLPAALDALDVRRHGGSWTGLASDVVVMGQAVLISGALNEIVKLAVRRPRPLIYDAAPDEPARADPDNFLSFYSGHTSTAFAAGMAYATTFALHHPHSAHRYLVYGAAATAGGGIGLLRMLSGKHFPSDVLTGAIVGGAIGVGVPLLHRRGRDGSVAFYPAGAGFVLTGTF